jgi:surface carbohydrate biosynthesis protein
MNVYIEVENFGREMEARMLLAMEIAGENNQVFISDRMQILNNAAYNLISKGIIFLKDLNSSSEIYILLKKARGNGFTIIATDEEAGIQFDDYENFIKVRSIKNLDNIDFLIAWGLRDKKVIKKNFPTTKTRILALGSPRIDLCHENFLKMKNFFCLKKIIDEKYILISSNISFPISIRPMINSIFNRVKEDDIDKDFREKYLYYKYGNHTLLCYHFIDLIRKIAIHFKDLTFVIRPHPNETGETWVKLLIEKFQNIKIIKSGSISDYIFNSELLIHSGCTSGIESYIMKKPSISYFPINLENSIDRGISDDLSIICKEPQQVIDIIKNLKNIKVNDNINNQIKFRIANLKYSKSYKKIHKIFKIINSSKKYQTENNDKVFLKKNLLFNEVKKNLKIFIKKKFNINENTIPFLEKFPPLNNNNIRDIFNDLIRTNEKFNTNQWKILNNSTLKIFKKSNC